ncbi:hypothetical protein Tco_0513812 [Tanacetum coccineum]
MTEGGIDSLTMEQYLALTRGNQAPSVVKPEIGGNVNFEIKSQFMRELREDTFSENKNNDAHEHVTRVLGPSRKRWVDRLPPEPSIPGISLKRPLSKGTIHHQKRPSSLKKSATSSRKEIRLYTKPRNGIMTYYINAPLMTSMAIRRRPSPFSNGAKYHIAPPGYYTCIDNRPPFREKRPSLEELMNKHLEESTRRRAEMEE